MIKSPSDMTTTLMAIPAKKKEISSTVNSSIRAAINEKAPPYTNRY
jgi:hypothetical protein